LGQTTLFIFCAGNELFFIALYLIKKWDVALPIGSPFIELGVQAPEIVAPFIANVTWPQLLAVVSAPICLAKQIINVVQLWKASKILVGVDLAQRQAARLEASMKED
jgi:CDP-diacylglycerol--inositol 3-phosphatidyltransferase